MPVCSCMLLQSESVTLENDIHLRNFHLRNTGMNPQVLGSYAGQFAKLLLDESNFVCKQQNQVTNLMMSFKWSSARASIVPD